MIKRLKPREKRFLLTGGIIILVIIAYQAAIWYSGIRSSMKEQIEINQATLQKQLNKISTKGEIEKKLETISTEIKELEKGLISADKPPLAAAEIQRSLKDIALSLGIDIKSEKALNPVDTGFYLAVPVEIGFTATTARLKDMLYRIKTSPLLFTISSMKLRVMNINNPVDVYATLVVQGFIKKAGANSKENKSGRR